MAIEDTLLKTIALQTKNKRYAIGLPAQEKDLLKALLKYVYQKVDDMPLGKIKKIVKEKKIESKEPVISRMTIIKRPKGKMFRVRSVEPEYNQLIEKGLVFTSARTPNTIYPKIQVNMG